MAIIIARIVHRLYILIAKFTKNNDSNFLVREIGRGRGVQERSCLGGGGDGVSHMTKVGYGNLTVNEGRQWEESGVSSEKCVTSLLYDPLINQ